MKDDEKYLNMSDEVRKLLTENLQDSKVKRTLRALNATKVNHCNNTDCKFHDFSKDGLYEAMDCILKNIEIDKNGKCMYYKRELKKNNDFSIKEKYDKTMLYRIVGKN